MSSIPPSENTNYREEVDRWGFAARPGPRILLTLIPAQDKPRLSQPVQAPLVLGLAGRGLSGPAAYRTALQGHLQELNVPSLSGVSLHHFL